MSVVTNQQAQDIRFKMPRQAHGRSLHTQGQAKPAKRKAARGRGLDALEVAERQNPEQTKIRQHRLGEIEDDDSDNRTRADQDERSTKRRKIADEPDNDGSEEGSDLEGNKWHLGVDEDDDDSDIDSDEAFGESDEERFSGFAFSGSKRQGPTSRPSKTKEQKQDTRAAVSQGDEDESELSEGDADGDVDEESDDLGDEAVDLATALDMNEEEERKERERANKKKQRRREEVVTKFDEEEDSDETADGGAQDEEQSELEISDEDDAGDYSRLQDFVAGLDTGPRNVPRDRSRLDPKSLPDKPSQFGLGSSKLTAADLLHYVKDPQQRQSLKILESAEKNGPESYTGGIPGKLAPPLAKRQQDRLDRLAAYDKSKETLGRWIETVKQNRRAEHISFPLQEPGASSAASTKQFAPTAQTQPMTSLESTIQEIMQESGMLTKGGAEQKEQEFEELQEKKMPLEEIQARRIELRKQRDLMFREEIRAKRIKKIKSKAYRRVHRKERDRADVKHHAQLAADGLLNSDDERERMDKQRAEERMGARHRESKWAKAVKATGRAAWDDDARHGVTDLARRDEELRRRMEGKEVRGSDASDLDSDFESDGASNTDEEYQGFDDQITRLQEDTTGADTSRLGSMAFMQRAEAARKAANDEELGQLQREIQADGVATEEISEHELPEAGRQRFGNKNQPAAAPSRRPLADKSDFEERMSEDDADVPEERALARVVSESLAATSTKPLSFSNYEGTQQRPAQLKSSAANTKASRDTKQRQTAAAKLKTRKTTGQATQEHNLDDYTSPSESEDEGHAALESLGGNQALAASIFAGAGDVVQDFEKEKKDVEEEEGDQVVDNTLPGWGSWAGAGVSKKEQKRAKGRFLTTVKGVAPEKRQDAKLDRVIINEKRNKKNSKYLATELPHPYESRQQYERSLRLPIGPEWTTKSTFQDATKPRVLMKQGIIKPMARPLA